MKWFLFVALLAVLGCRKDASSSDADYVARDAVNIEIATQVDVLYSDSAQVKARIRAPELERHVNRVDPKEVFNKGIDVVFYDPTGAEQSYLTGGTAVRLSARQQTFIRDLVVWESVAGERLETSELVWDESKQIISSDKFVKISRPGEIIYGIGFKTNSQLTDWRIDAVEGIIKTTMPQ
jgi:LPS export ABC transporter protein LptC